MMVVHPTWIPMIIKQEMLAYFSEIMLESDELVIQEDSGRYIAFIAEHRRLDIFQMLKYSYDPTKQAKDLFFNCSSETVRMKFYDFSTDGNDVLKKMLYG